MSLQTVRYSGYCIFAVQDSAFLQRMAEELTPYEVKIAEFGDDGQYAVASDWCKSLKHHYMLNFGNWQFRFADRNDALMFKLMWGA